jgi:hypothetical protein
MSFYRRNVIRDVPQELIELLVATASDNSAERNLAQEDFAKAITTPLRQAVLYGDIVRNIFTPVKYAPGTTVEWPLDLLAPGQEDEFVAFTSPGIGRPGERRVEGDYVTVPTYEIKNAIQWSLRYAREANWPIVARALRVLEAGFVKKINNDGWNVILTAVVDRDINVNDADAEVGQFTKRLVSLLKTVMIRNAGGNTASVGRGKLTDIFLSPEAVEDIRNWNVDQVDELTRREIYLSSDDGERLTRIFGVNLHPLNEFGQNQEYQLFVTDRLGAQLPAGDVELVVGLDMSADDSFIMPYKREIQIYHDDNLHRRGEEGYYGDGEFGWGVMDNRRVIAGSF